MDIQEYVKKSGWDYSVANLSLSLGRHRFMIYRQFDSGDMEAFDVAIRTAKLNKCKDLLSECVSLFACFVPEEKDFILDNINRVVVKCDDMIKCDIKENNYREYSKMRYKENTKQLNKKRVKKHRKKIKNRVITEELKNYSLAWYCKYYGTTKNDVIGVTGVSDYFLKKWFKEKELVKIDNAIKDTIDTMEA